MTGRSARGHRLRRRWRAAFAFRLLVAFALTLLVAGAAHYALAVRQLRATAADAGLTRYEVEAAAASSASPAAEPGGRPSPAAAELLARLARRPEVTVAALVTANGTVDMAVRGGSECLDTAPERVALTEVTGASNRAVIDIAMATGRPRYAPDTRRDGSLYVVPMTVGGTPHALVVVENGTVLQRQIGGLRQLDMLTAVLGVLMGVPLFYLLGGRSLAAAHRRAVQESSTDSLTGLGNHSAFHEDLQGSVSGAARRRHDLIVAAIDLDFFKQVNDSCGHQRGDAVLRHVAHHLRSVHPAARAYRVGGDEFALVLPGVHLAVALGALDRLACDIAERLSPVSLSIGVAQYDRDARKREDLWQCADAALYEAKRLGRNRLVSADELGVDSPVVHPAKAAALRTLLDEQAMGVAFQPICDTAGTAVLGHEAFARPPVGGHLTNPQEAFDIAERLGLVAELDDLCRMAALAHAGNLPPQTLLFLNLAPSALGHPLTAPERLLSTVREAGLSPDRVVIELTERGIHNRDLVIQEADRLHALGFQLALGNVGAGKAGIDLMGVLPLRYVKVDRSIVAGAADSPRHRAALLAIITYAHTVGIYVIAEGVETLATMQSLQRMHTEAGVAGIHATQGYLLGRPQPRPSSSAEPTTVQVPPPGCSSARTGGGEEVAVAPGDDVVLPNG